MVVYEESTVGVNCSKSKKTQVSKGEEDQLLRISLSRIAISKKKKGEWRGVEEMTALKLGMISKYHLKQKLMNNKHLNLFLAMTKTFRR